MLEKCCSKEIILKSCCQVGSLQTCECMFPVPLSSSSPLSVMQCYAEAKAGLSLCSISGWLGVSVFCFWKKLCSVGLVDQLFQPASKEVEIVEKAFA